MSKASLRALGQRAGFDLAQHRFRGNLWIDDLPAWEEEEWVGRTVRIGEVELNVRERIIRCQAIASNPTTGKRDFDTLSHLETARRTPEFGVNAEITKPGKISLNDVVEVF